MDITTHSIQIGKKKLANQIEKKIQSQSIDDYAKENCDHIRKSFEILIIIQKLSRKSTILRYEDMINDFSKFSDELNLTLHFSQDIYSKLYQLTRPLDKIDENSHKRSGKPGDYQKS